MIFNGPLLYCAAFAVEGWVHLLLKPETAVALRLVY